MINGVNVHIYIEFRPTDMSRCRLLDVDDFTDRGIFEPREVVVGKEEFALTNKEPHTVAGYVRYLNP